MPLDDPLTIGLVSTLRGGMNNDQPPALITREEAESITNWRLNRQALGIKRKGLELVSDISGTDRCWGLKEFHDPSSDAVLFAAVGTKIYTWSGSPSGFSELVTSTGADPIVGDSAVTLIQCRDFNNSRYDMFVINRTGTNWYWPSAGALREGSQVPNGRCAAFFLERLWVGDEEGIVHSSDIGDPTQFNSLNTYKVGDGRKIQALVQFMNAGLIAFLEDSIWLMDIDQDLLFQGQLDGTQIHALNTEIGTTSPRSVQQAGNDIFFMSRHGVHRMSKTEQDKTQAIMVPLSEKISSTIDRVNWTVADKFQGVIWENTYLLSVALDDDSDPQHVLAYDIRNEAWSIFDTWDGGAWARSQADGYEELYMGNSTGTSSIYKAFSGKSDNGADIASVIDFREEDMDAPHLTKEFQYLEIHVAINEGGTLKAYAKADSGSFVFLGDMDLSADLPQLPIQMQPEVPGGTPGFRLRGAGVLRKKFHLRSKGHPHTMQFRFSVTGTKEVELLRYIVAARLDEERLN